MDDIAKIAGGLSAAQREALIRAAFLLDAIADEGIGAEVEMLSGETVTVFAEDVVLLLSEAFGIRLVIDVPAPLGIAVRDALRSQNDG